ncbi:MAG TPA: type IV pilus secretin PilQ [Anaeromyxobacteraceae bacterium]|jgi:type IV pilus assembly protein PilQ|nr:type IV pilus secretin PilQ [Anaeromyxobacteraceae bacterium]
MKTTTIRLACLTSLVLAAGSARAAGAPNAIRAIDVADRAGAVEIDIRGTRAPSYTVFKLQDPPRLVLDLAGADVSQLASPIAVGKDGVLAITTAQYKDEKSSVGRVVVALEQGARYEVGPRGDAVTVKVTRGEALAAPAPVKAAPERLAVAGPSDNVLSRRADEAPVGKAATAVTGVKVGADRIALAVDGDVGRIEVLELANPPRLALDLMGVSKAPRQPVSGAGAFRQVRFGRDHGKVRVVLDAAGELPKFQVKRLPGSVVVAFAAEPAMVAQAAPAAAPVAPLSARVHAEAAAAEAAPAPAPVAPAAHHHHEDYAGRRITLDFHDIDIRNLLRLIADVSKRNIVVADDVTGKVTVSLRNVPWDQALELVLKTKGLDKEELGNVIRVAKSEQIAKERQARLDAVRAQAPLLPLKVRLIPVNFARANDVSGRVKDVLSDRGTVSTDDRTNVLIVKDVAENLERAEKLVRNLDTEIPQVLIESRIVEASSNFNRALGVQWGGNATASAATGNATGISFPNTVGATGASGGGPVTGTSSTPNYAVNLPAAIGQGSGGGLGFVFGSASGAFNLNLRLSALESTGVVKTISAPKIATIDNREATIGQGISIPFSQTSAAGVNTTFIEAKLELKVTPHVSSDGSILLKIKATNNSPNSSLTGANGQPSITKREAETEVLVKDGDTTVIGGIYTRQTARQESSVPWLGKIPVLGFFFRSRTESDDHTELLIFITPRILNRQPLAQNAVAGG